MSALRRELLRNAPNDSNLVESVMRRGRGQGYSRRTKLEWVTTTMSEKVFQHVGGDQGESKTYRI